MASGRLRIGFSTPGAYSLAAAHGSYALSGGAAGLLIARRMLAGQGAYTLTGQTADLVYASQAQGLAWPAHSPGYIPVLPRHGGYGMDTPGGTGRNLATPATAVYLIDSLGTSNTGTARPELGANVFSGTFQYCWRANPTSGGVPLPKVIVPIVSGWVNSGGTAGQSIPGQAGTVPTAGFFSYWGQFAPAPGLFLRGTRPAINGGGNVVIMHLRSYMGDDAAGLGAGNRDAFYSGYAAGIAQNVVLLNCEFCWSVDEIIDFFRRHHLVTWAYNAFINPLHNSVIEHPGDPIDEDHGFGPIFGGAAEGQPGSFCMYRNLLAGITGRGPATNAQAVAIANNLYYNAGGRPNVGSGEAIDIWSQNTSLPMIANVVGNGFIRGPNHGSSIIAMRVRSGAPAGTQGYLSDNVVHGWTAASQASLLNSGVSGYQQGTLRSGAWPGSWGTEATGALHWAADPQNPTADEWAAYVDLHDEGCGAQPALRSSSYGRVANVFAQARARLAGGSTTNQFIDTVGGTLAEGGDDGWFSVPNTAIDPTNPGAHWHAPLPTGAGRDTPYTTGTFSNGLSRVGRSPLEVWAIEEHWRKGGK